MSVMQVDPADPYTPIWADNRAAPPAAPVAPAFSEPSPAVAPGSVSDGGYHPAQPAAPAFGSSASVTATASAIGTVAGRFTSLAADAQDAAGRLQALPQQPALQAGNFPAASTLSANVGALATAWATAMNHLAQALTGTGSALQQVATTYAATDDANSVTATDLENDLALAAAQYQAADPSPSGQSGSTGASAG
jgi:hypothetical protein